MSWVLGAWLVFWVGKLLFRLVVWFGPWLRSFELSFAEPEIEPHPDDGAPGSLGPELDAAGMPVVVVLPFHGGEDAALRAIGVACSRLSIRRLMRAPAISVRGPEDTPIDAVASPADVPVAWAEAHHVLGGRLESAEGVRTATLWLRAPGGELREARLTLGAWTELTAHVVDRVTAWLARPLGAAPKLAPGTEPSNDARMAELGDTLLAADAAGDDLERDEILLRALDRSLELGVVATGLSRYALRAKLRVLAACPDDAQLCFSIFESAWNGNSAEPRAFTHLRRALLHAPSHGKANAAAYCAAPMPWDHGTRARLGFALLPGSAFASRTYARWLASHGRDPDLLCKIAHAHIERAPADPAGYWALMRGYEKCFDLPRALDTARNLAQLLDPLDPRTRAVIEADSALTASREQPGWSPLPELRERIAGYERELSKRA